MVLLYFMVCGSLKGHSQLSDRADLDTSFHTLKKVAILRIFIGEGTMAAAFYNQTNVNGAIERNIIPAMVQCKVKVLKILS